jgi:hypothetical protein
MFEAAHSLLQQRCLGDSWWGMQQQLCRYSNTTQQLKRHGAQLM